MKNSGIGSALVAVLTLTAAPALAAQDVYLIALPFTEIMPDGVEVEMWGFAEDLDGDLTEIDDEVPTAPGPVIRVAPGETTLNIHLRNELPGPISLVIPGQIAATNPTWVDSAGDVVAVGARPPGDVTSRIRSVATEVDPEEIATYTWTNIRPGTFLYRSGTHPAVQVQMGLSGALIVDAAPDEAYPGVPYDNEAILVYSEIDPALHEAVENGDFGTGDFSSTIDYEPKYFFINGASYPFAVPIVARPISTSDTVLVRLLNAGLRNLVPVIQDQRMTVVAEDGYPYPYSRDQSSALLAAGKTKDAILDPMSAGSHAVYERRLNLSNAGSSPGGMLVYLEVAHPAGAPVAVGEGFSFDEDVARSIAAPGVLGNDMDTDPLSAVLATDVTAGALLLNADGSFTYTPPANFNGSAAFTYRASDGTLLSETATVAITVDPVNDLPTAAPDSYRATQDTPLAVAAPAVLANDRDVDGDPLSASLVTGPANGSLSLAPDGGFSYSPNLLFTGTDSFAYVANDGVADSAQPATVTISVNPPVNVPPVAVDDDATTNRNTPITIAVLANDSDPDGSLDPATVAIVDPPSRGGAAVPNADGTITYTPRRNFRGTEVFTYTVRDTDGSTSNAAKVTLNVVR